MKVLDINIEEETVNIVDGTHMRQLDNEGNPVLDQCGRPVYIQAHLKTFKMIHKRRFTVSDNGELYFISEKDFKRRYGSRQLRKEIRQHRILTNSNYGVRPE